MLGSRTDLATSLPGEVHHRIDFMARKDLLDLRADTEIDMAKKHGTRNRGTMAFLVVQRDHADSAREQNFGANASNVACRACD